MKFIDSHCHLDFEIFDVDRGAVFSKAHEAGVVKFIVPGVRAKQWHNLLKFADKYSDVYYSLGIHPYFLVEFQHSDLDLLHQLAMSSDLIAVGECGLDSSISNMQLQQQVFEAQIELANTTKKPLIIHHRRSHHLIHQSFKVCKPKFGGVIHSFTGSIQDANKYIDLGFKLGVGGSITYDRANKTRQTLASIGLEHLVLETDSPDMPLAGLQGQRNEPSRITLIAAELALIKQQDIEEIAKQTNKNVQQVFGLTHFI